MKKEKFTPNYKDNEEKGNAVSKNNKNQPYDWKLLSRFQYILWIIMLLSIVFLFFVNAILGDFTIAWEMLKDSFKSTISGTWTGSIIILMAYWFLIFHLSFIKMKNRILLIIRVIIELPFRIFYLIISKLRETIFPRIYPIALIFFCFMFLYLVFSVIITIISGKHFAEYISLISYLTFSVSSIVLTTFSNKVHFGLTNKEFLSMYEEQLELRQGNQVYDLTYNIGIFFTDVLNKEKFKIIALKYFSEEKIKFYIYFIHFFALVIFGIFKYGNLSIKHEYLESILDVSLLSLATYIAYEKIFNIINLRNKSYKKI